MIPTLTALSDFDHSVLALNRTVNHGNGFTTEYVIQHSIIANWEQTPWGERYDIVQDEFRVDGGLTSRRIDILARERLTGDWLVIELKRAEASPAAVHQVADDLLALGNKHKFIEGQLDCVLVAERVPAVVRALAKSQGVAAYEVDWPLYFNRVA